MTPAEVAECLRKYPLEDDAAKVLVELARERGGSDGDNISLAITRWESGAAGTDRGLLAKLRAYLPWRRAAR